jgi:hypothetical protein
MPFRGATKRPAEGWRAQGYDGPTRINDQLLPADVLAPPAFDEISASVVAPEVLVLPVMLIFAVT